MTDIAEEFYDCIVKLDSEKLRYFLYENPDFDVDKKDCDLKKNEKITPRDYAIEKLARLKALDKKNSGESANIKNCENIIFLLESSILENTIDKVSRAKKELEFALQQTLKLYK